jgi:hypothetical protein
MYFITGQSKIFYKCCIISVISTFLAFVVYIPPCQAIRERAQIKKHTEKIDRIAALQDEIDIEPKTWGQAGRLAYESAARTMATLSPEGEPLDEGLKSLLTPYFGDLVSRIIVHWDTQLVKEWKHQNYKKNYSITLKGKETQAQTYGYHIYIKFLKPERYDWDFLKLLIHQIVHVQQFEKLGGNLAEFGYQYFSGYKNAGQVYEKNRIEEEAEFYTNIYIDRILEAIIEIKKESNN